MPYIIVQIWYPTDLNTEVTEKFLEVVKEFPFDRSAWGRKRMGGFQSIKGLEYDMRLWTTLTEAFEGTEYSVP
jgi:hypothetical protein